MRCGQRPVYFHDKQSTRTSLMFYSLLQRKQLMQVAPARSHSGTIWDLTIIDLWKYTGAHCYIGLYLPGKYNRSQKMNYNGKYFRHGKPVALRKYRPQVGSISGSDGAGTWSTEPTRARIPPNYSNDGSTTPPSSICQRQLGNL